MTGSRTKKPALIVLFTELTLDPETNVFTPSVQRWKRVCTYIYALDKLQNTREQKQLLRFQDSNPLLESQETVDSVTLQS